MANTNEKETAGDVLYLKRSLAVLFKLKNEDRTMFTYDELKENLELFYKKYYPANDATFGETASGYWCRFIASRPMSEAVDHAFHVRLNNKITELDATAHRTAPEKALLLADEMLKVLQTVVDDGDALCATDSAKFVRETLNRHYEIDYEFAYAKDRRARAAGLLPSYVIGGSAKLGWTGFLTMLEDAHETQCVAKPDLGLGRGEKHFARVRIL